MKNTFDSLSFSFNRNQTFSTISRSCCIGSLISCFRSSMWAVHSWSWRANIEWEGTGMDFNKPEAYCAFVRLSLSTQRLYQREEGGWTPLVLSTRPRHGRRQRSDSNRVELGWWVDGERGRKELKPWGLHCCSGGDYDWQANSFHSFSFFSSFSLSPPPLPFFVPSSPSGSARSRCPQGPASCYHPGLASPL